jgi:integrase
MIRTVEDLFVAWPAAASGLRRRTDTTIEHTLKMARPFRATFGRRVLADLEPVEMARWAAKHRAQVRYVKTILADAMLMGVLSASPMAEAASYRVTSGRDFIPTREQVDALAVAGERYGLREWVHVASSSGARLTALAALTKRRVLPGPSPDVMELRLPRKGRAGLYPAVLLQPGVTELAYAMGTASGRGPIFRRPGGDPWDVRTISERWVKMRRSLGLPEECTSHCLRKFYATRLLDQGVSYADTAIALDHVDAQGRPNIDLVQSVYGRPDRAAALARIAGLAA